MASPCIYTIKGEQKTFEEYISMLNDMDDAEIDALIEKGSKKVESEKKESKFNMRQRLGIPINEAIQNLADKDRLVYDVSTNKELLSEANERIEKNIDEAYEFATQEDPKASELTKMFAVSGGLIPIMEEAIKNADSEDAKAFWMDKLDNLRKATQKQATIGGQAIQALSTVGNIMPLRDAIVISVEAQRNAFIQKGIQDAKFEESVRKGAKEEAERIADNIVKNDSKVAELEAKIIELEAKIAGKKKAKREAAARQAIEKIDSLIKNMAFSDATGLVVIINQGLELIKASIKAKKKIADAIDEAVVYINAKSKGVKWDEDGFRKRVNESLADERQTLDEAYEEKQATLEAKKQLKQSIRKGLISGDFSDLKTLLSSKNMEESAINTYVEKLQKKHETEVVQAVSKRIQKNLGLSEPTGKQEMSVARKVAMEEKLTDAEKEALFKKKNKLEDITKEQQEKLKQLYDEVERVSQDPDLKMEALDKLRHEAQKLVPKSKIKSWLNYFDSVIYYPNILSSPATSAVNILDATWNTIGLGMLLRKGGIEAFKDQFKGLKRGFDIAKIGLNEGFLNEGMLNNGDPNNMELIKRTAEDYSKEGDKIAKYYSKWVGRAMAMPNILGNATKYSALSFIVQRDLKSQGYKGRELVDKKNEILFGTETKRDAYEKKAQELVYGKQGRTGDDVVKEAKVRRTISNLILSDMQKQMKTEEGKEALDIAKNIQEIATYQRPADGFVSLLPKLEKGLSHVKIGKVNAGEALQFLLRKVGGFEFLNTSANIANTAMNFTPYGYARANNIGVATFLNKIGVPEEMTEIISHPDYKDAKNYEQKARILQKANLGTALITLGIAMVIKSASDDEDDPQNKNRFITGSLKPSSFIDGKAKYVHEKEANKSIPAHSVKLPDGTWWNYSGTILKAPLSILGNMSDYLYSIKHKDLTKQDYLDAILWGSVQSLKSVTIDGTPLGRQLEANRPQKSVDTENFKSQMAEWATHRTANLAGILVPNLIKSIGKQIDPTNYTPKDFSSIVAKQMGILNWYSALGGNSNIGYAVDLLGNKVTSKSGDKYFNSQVLKPTEEDKKLYDLLLEVYKEPSDYPSLLKPDIPVSVKLMEETEYDRKVKSIASKYERGEITKDGMQNRLDALEKERNKVDDIVNDPKMYSEALEYCGSLFKKGLQEEYDNIMSMKNNKSQKDLVNKILSSAKNQTKLKYAQSENTIGNE